MNDLIGFTAKITKNNRITIPIEIRELLKIKEGLHIYLMIDIVKSKLNTSALSGKIFYRCDNCNNIFDPELFERYGGICPRCNNQIIKYSH